MQYDDVPRHIIIMSVRNTASGSKRGGRPVGKPKRGKGCKRRPVIQSKKDGTFIAKHKSIVAAASSVNAHPQSISRCCRLLQETTVGYKWEYAD